MQHQLNSKHSDSIAKSSCQNLKQCFSKEQDSGIVVAKATSLYVIRVCELQFVCQQQSFHPLVNLMFTVLAEQRLYIKSCMELLHRKRSGNVSTFSGIRFA